MIAAVKTPRQSQLDGTAASRTKPNFFIVGKPKCGTSTLHAILDQHPDIYMSKVKEPHHFHGEYMEEAGRRNTGYRGLPYRELAAYLELFDDATTERIVGESSTGYLYSKRAAGKIAQFNPHAKILMIFREPVDFLRSLHSQLLRSANENEPDFRNALMLEESRKRGENIPATTSYPGNLFYTEQAKYSEQAERFLEAFARSQIKILIFEDFKKDNLGVYREVLEFLGVDESFRPRVVKLQAYRGVRFVKLANWLTYHGEKKEGALGQRAPGWLIDPPRRVLGKVFFKDAERTPLDPAFRRDLAAQFKPEVIRLSEVSGIDLVEKWGYDHV